MAWCNDDGWRGGGLCVGRCGTVLASIPRSYSSCISTSDQIDGAALWYVLWLLFRLNSRDGTEESSLGLGWPPSLPPPPEVVDLPLRRWAAAATAASSRYPRGWRGGVGGSSDEVSFGRRAVAVGDDEGGWEWLATAAAEADARAVADAVGWG